MGWNCRIEKTRIVHIDQGVDFLGFNVRKYNGKLLIKPAKPSIAAVKEKAREILKAGASLPQDVLIRRLNPVIRGWGNYYRHVVSKEVLDGIDWVRTRGSEEFGVDSTPTFFVNGEKKSGALTLDQIDELLAE